VNRTIYYQSAQDGLPLNRNVWAALEGFMELGWERKSFQASDLSLGYLKITEEDIAVGNIGVVRASIRLLGKVPPEPIDYPECLKSFLHRKVQKTTWGEAFQMLGKEDEVKGYPNPLFVKPQEQKVWTGCVIRRFKDLIKIGEIPPNFPVLVSEPITFVSEYRAYVVSQRGIIGLHHYNGDPWIVPDRRVVYDMLHSMRMNEDIAAYSLDVGITNKGETVLVEVNDAYALGNYGLPSIAYANMLLTRWTQILDIP
jgi:hypothetical protein